MKYFNNLWFTLVELIVSISISSIILMSIFYFISWNIEEIFLSKNKTEFYNDLNVFKNDINNISNTYYSWSIFENISWTWSDILLLKSNESNHWFLIWVVDKNTMKLESWSLNYLTYTDKVLWYAKISSYDIDNINLNDLYVYDIYFHRDHLYENLKIRDFQVNLYNSWALIDIYISTIKNYNEEFENEKFSDLSWTIDLSNSNIVIWSKNNVWKENN